MIPTTQAWKDYSVDFSNYQPYILVTKNADVVWSFTVDNIQEGTLRFTDDISSLGGFNIGATPSNHFECDIINFDQTFPSPDVFEGCMARLYFFLSETPTLGGTNAVVGQAIVGQAIVNTESSWTTDYICRGHYYLDPITSVGSTVHLSGSDAMSLEEFNSSNMDGYKFGGKTCMKVVKELGFNLQTTFPNYDYVLSDVVCDEEHSLSGVSKRTILGHIASLCGCYARHNHEGQLELRKLGDDPTVTPLTKIMEEPDIDYYPIEVTGAYVTGAKDIEAVFGGVGYYLFVEHNPLITSNDEAYTIATQIATLYNEFQIRPFSVDIIADPSLEAGDIVEFEVNGETVQCIITSISYHDGGISTISAEADSDTHATAEAASSSMGYVKRALIDLYSGDTLKKIINFSGDSVKIKADTIDLTGAVMVDGTINCNERFKVNPDGTMIANNAIIKGGEISISKETSNPSWDTAVIHLETYSPNSIFPDSETKLRSTGLEFVDYTDQNFAFFYTRYMEYGIHCTAEDDYFDLDWHSLYNFIDTFYEISTAIENDTAYGYIKLGKLENANKSYTDGTTHYNTPTIQLNGYSGNITCVSLTQTSDRESKEDIQTLDKEKSSEFIYRLKPVSFKFKGLDRVHHGFVAQDVEEISDWDLVTESDGKKALSYTDIIADLVATVQKQNERIEQLERRLDGIK